MVAMGAAHPLPAASDFAPTVQGGACLTYDAPASSRLDLARDPRTAGHCRGASVPLVREKSVGEDWIKGGLEIDSSVFGQGGTPEVKMKFDLHRHLLDGAFGFDAALDASIARLLGPSPSGFDQRLHLSAEKSFNGGWQTGIEAEFRTLGGLAFNHASEHSSLVQWRTRYTFSTDDGAEQQLEFKLTDETAQGELLNPSPSSDVRAELGYRYRQDGNVLSLAVSFTGVRQSNSRDNDVRAELRLARPF